MRSTRFSTVLRQAGWRALAGFFGTLIVVPAVLFAAAGRLDWWPGWAVVGVTVLSIVGSRIALIWRNPGLALERARGSEKTGVQAWDRVIMPLSMLFFMPATWIVAGLDVRWGWSPPPTWWVQGIALLVVILAYLLAVWAMLANAYFSSYARLQTERGQRVVEDGPYQCVRHPGYAGGLLSGLATPLLLGSLWALLPALAAAVLLMIRTALEDRMLQAGLPGYNAYTRRVRWRLVPWVW